MLKIHGAMEGHKLLLQFCKQFQRLYGKDKVTPNMHMHMHILNCILDYGPVYAFWLFSFERYNGILGSYRTNNRSIEVQLMRHFVQEMEIGKLHIRDESYTAHSIVQELDQTTAVVGTLNDMLALNSNSHLEIQTPARTHTCAHTRTHAHKHTRAHTHARAHSDTNTCTHTHTHTRAHICTHTPHTHTHTHTHILLNWFFFLGGGGGGG